MKLKIAIVDDHAIFRKSLLLLIDTFNNAEVVLQASNGKELMAQLAYIDVDIVLLDLQMPEIDGFETCELLRISHPEIKILVLTHHNTTNTILKVMRLGVDGYITKEIEPSELQQALIHLFNAGFYFEKSLSGIIKEISSGNLQVPVNSLIFHFTDREKEITIMTAKGYSGKEIANKLCISLRTVEVHKKNIMEKTKSKNFISVVLQALHLKIIKLEDVV